MGEPQTPIEVYEAVAGVLVPYGTDEESGALFEFRHCKDCPSAPGPCACTGRSWPSEAVRAAVDVAYRAGLVAAYPLLIREVEDDANFWFGVAVNTATRLNELCPRCKDPVEAHWPDDGRGQPGCHRPECYCSWTPQEALTALNDTASMQCPAQYERPGGRERGDRIVHCHLEAGHPGEHEEADTEVTWIDAAADGSSGEEPPDG